MASRDALRRSIRQLLSLTMIRILRLRPFQTGFYLGQRDSQQFGSFADGNKVLRQSAVAQSLEAQGPLSLSPLTLWLKFLRFLSAPATCDGLKSVGQNRFTNYAHLPQPHEQSGATHSIEPLDINQFFVSESIALLAYFTQQVFPWHQERASKHIRGFLFVLVAQAVGVYE